MICKYMFFFKGDRKYLNSADVYSFLKKNFQFKSTDIKFYKFKINTNHLK